MPKLQFIWEKNDQNLSKKKLNETHNFQPCWTCFDYSIMLLFQSVLIISLTYETIISKIE